MAGLAFGDGVEGLLERGTRHQPGFGAEKGLRGFLAVSARRALIGRVGE